MGGRGNGIAVVPRDDGFTSDPDLTDGRVVLRHLGSALVDQVAGGSASDAATRVAALVADLARAMPR